MPNISGKIKITALPKGTCPVSVEALLDHIQKQGSVELPFDNGSLVLIGSEEPAVDERGYPWFKLDANGSLLGIFCYSSKAGKWVRDFGAVKGEIRTVARTEETLAADRELKGFDDSWQLCDGSNNLGIDLRDKDKDIVVTIATTPGTSTGSTTIKVPEIRGYFEGSAANWDRYTVVYVGY